MSRRHRRHRRSKLRSLHLWHRYLGVSAGVLVLILALTGLLLNHTADLGLAERHVGHPWLLDWYGIEAPPAPVTFAAGDALVTLLGDRLYYNLQPVPGRYHGLAGAVKLEDFLVAAVDDGALLLTPGGELIEHLGAAAGTPAGIRRIGVGRHGNLVADSAQGIHEADAGLLAWSSRDEGAAGVRWARPTRTPSAIQEALAAGYRGRILSVERVVLDLHSGRILGTRGHLVMDAAAVALLLLAVTGTLMWWRRR